MNKDKKLNAQRLVTEIPSSLKQLARFVVRGFYTIEDALVVDMLVRNPCMKEDDICELLKFERKQLRARITILKNDKFLQVRLKMETGPDGKAAKVNYYFINYKTFVNVVKYKLDLMRKRMETEERDATSRASFKCPNCCKTFTDLEADQLFDFTTSEFRCTFCGSPVEEDLSALPKKDSRLLLAKFNEQLQPLYDLLREVEEIKLSPECLEPEPVDIDTIRGITKANGQRQANEPWSGEATRSQGFAVEEARVDITIDGSDTHDTVIKQKDRPIWMTESTVITNDNHLDSADAILQKAAAQSSNSSQSHTGGSGSNSNSSSSSSSARNKKESEDIMSVLLQHEKQSGVKQHPMTNNAVKSLYSKQSQRNHHNNHLHHNHHNHHHHHQSSDSSDDEVVEDMEEINEVENMETDSEDDVDNGPTVTVSGKSYPIDQINDDLIARMTQSEKDTYIQVYQEHYSHMYD